MRKITVSFLLCLLVVGFSYSQTEEVTYTSMEEALKFPEKVYRLKLSYNKNHEIPHEIGKLVNLQYLAFNDNSFSKLPPEIGNLKNLKTLRIVCTRFTNLPKELTSLTNLEELTFRGNMDCEFYDVRISKQIISLISKMTNLRRLDLSFLFHFNEFPIEICDMTKLEELTITFTDMTIVPPEIGKLVALKELHLGDNKIKSIPISISKLTRLESLDLSQNRLTKLPFAIGKLSNLKKLNLENEFDEGNSFSEAEKAKIRRLLPHTEIVVD